MVLLVYNNKQKFMNTGKKEHSIFIEGPIQPSFIADNIQQHSNKKNIGAHNIFLGQVRADEMDGKKVIAITYSSYEAMALAEYKVIREEIFVQFDLTCLHVYHSIGRVAAGEICLFVFASSKHRKIAFAACEAMVEKIKIALPIWGQELFEDDRSQWKLNQ